MEKLSQKAQEAIRRLVDDLINGNYAQIEEDGRIGRLTQDELRGAVADYGRTLTQLPESAFDVVDIYTIQVAPDLAAVDVPLWTKEEGRSDLTLSVTVNERVDGVAVSIDDLHVL